MDKREAFPTNYPTNGTSGWHSALGAVATATALLATLLLADVGTVCAAVRDGPSPLEPVDDYLELLVIKALAEDPALASYDLLVLADGSDVSLYGSVDSDRDRQLAASLAASVEGVREVRNDIQVVQPTYVTSKGDQAIENDFWRLVRARLDTVPDSVAIRVQNGEAILSGRVASRARQEILVAAAFDAGAVLVKPELQIASRPSESFQ